MIILRAEPNSPETPSPDPDPAPAPIPTSIPAPAPTPAPAVELAPAPVVPLALPLQPCSRPFAHPDLVLSVTAQQGSDAARVFNKALRRKLTARQGPVIVDLAQPFPADKTPPPALAAWLARIKSSGGAVRNAQYCEQGRGLFGFLRRSFSSDSSSDYAVVEGFDAVQHIDGLDQTVTQIEFRAREAAK